MFLIWDGSRSEREEGEREGEREREREREIIHNIVFIQY